MSGARCWTSRVKSTRRADRQKLTSAAVARERACALFVNDAPGRTAVRKLAGTLAALVGAGRRRRRAAVRGRAVRTDRTDVLALADLVDLLGDLLTRLFAVERRRDERDEHADHRAERQA